MSVFSCASSRKKFNSAGLWLQLCYAAIKGAGESFSGFEEQKGQVCSDSTTGGLLLPPPPVPEGTGDGRAWWPEHITDPPLPRVPA